MTTQLTPKNVAEVAAWIRRWHPVGTEVQAVGTSVVIAEPGREYMFFLAGAVERLVPRREG